MLLYTTTLLLVQHQPLGEEGAIKMTGVFVVPFRKQSVLIGTTQVPKSTMTPVRVITVFYKILRQNISGTTRYSTDFYLKLFIYSECEI